MKIVLLTHNFHPFVGGIEVISEFLAEVFVEAGHQVRILTWTVDSDESLFPFDIIRKPNYIELIRSCLWAEMIFENNPSLQLSWPALFVSRPHVVAVHTWICRSNGSIGLKDRLKMKHLKRVDEVVAVSEAIREKCKVDALVIGNPYRKKDFKVLAKVERSKDFVFLGRLVSDKGVDLAIKAISHLNKRTGQKYSLTIIGDGPERLSLEKLVTHSNMEDRIKFTGELRGEQLEFYLNKHKILLVPSVWEEPFGNVVLEGMACGCIPIVSDGGGLPEAVGSAGLTFQRGDLYNLIATIERLLSDPGLQVKLQQAAEKHLMAHHPQAIAKRYLKVIESATKKNKNVYT